MPEPANFHDHADAFRDATEAMETNTHEQFRLRDEIHYADKRIAEMESDALVAVIQNLAALDRKSNAAERDALAAKDLAVHGPYMDAVRSRAEHNRDLMVVAAKHDLHRRNKRGAELYMLWLIKNAPAGAERG